MNLMKKFNEGKNHKKYFRIDPDYKLDAYVGYNEEGQMSLSIIENGRIEKINSSKFIHAQLNKRNDGKLVLSFDLQDSAYISTFLVLCSDLIEMCECNGKDKAIQTAIERWNFWRDMFSNKQPDILSKKEIKGLIGELIVLSEFMIKKHGHFEAINSWMGPLLGHKDFEFGDEWIEVKSINTASNQVTISSLEQLDSQVEGKLIIVRLEDTNSSVDDAINLNSIVNEIVEDLDSSDIMQAFQMKLYSAGYAYNKLYDDINFRFEKMETYKVVDEFPRLTRGNVNLKIGNAKYTILLDGIESFKEK